MIHGLDTVVGSRVRQAMPSAMMPAPAPLSVEAA
ncbi:Uncharacterised protein [Bordetella pertussis]|nr:Uncharacterised protein [Bordetella pertussis]CPK06452.1 Uncharacterised protein [Bordetella pertussis]